jgi:2-C-methyl-D-erythritol 4-phosphate cytidylyltransferase
LVLALILAAGRGERLGAGQPKALAQLAGKPLLQWSVDVLARVPAIERIVVALPASPQGAGAPGAEGAGARAAQGAIVPLPPAVTAPEQTIGVVGGTVRSQSVRLGLAAAAAGAHGGARDLVLIHDAARPLLTASLAEAVVDAVHEGDLDGAIAAVPVTDTIKRVDSERVIAETLDRSSLWAVQTPQVFRRETLQRALDVSDELLARATDDAWLVERIGGRVAVVEAPRENLKITTPFDLRLAELLLASRPA